MSVSQAFQVEGFLLTYASSPDPFKAEKAYELDKIVDYLDWVNVMTYDYSGPWDPYTGVNAPLYGRWGEGFIGHPKYQFNVHQTIQYYLKYIPAEKLVLGIHTEAKGWTLNRYWPFTSCLPISFSCYLHLMIFGSLAKLS